MNVTSAGSGKSVTSPSNSSHQGRKRDFSRQEWLQLFVSGNHDKLCDEFIRVLQHFIATIYYSMSAETRAFTNDFVENFLYFFCHPDFSIPQAYIPAFIKLQPVIANVVALSDFGTTTPWVLRLTQQKENYFKLLTLHNVRCAVEIDPTLFFDINPFLASHWWNFYWMGAPAFCRKETYERIRKHLKSLDDRHTLIGTNSRLSYFPVTYVAPECEQIAKNSLNRLIASAFSNVSIRNSPQKRKIALVTGRWYRSAVYTSLAPLVKSLAGKYDISLVHFGGDGDRICDREMFEKVISVQLKDNRMDLDALQDNHFAAAIYPDIGMTAESIYLANIRIAPIQAMMYGHPVSTWGSAIDYFIGGQKVEDRSRATANYSERLVLLPGMGVYPVYPDDFELPAAAPDSDPFLINCGWTSQKISYPLLAALQEVLAGARKPVAFQIFPGKSVAECNGFIPFVKDLHSMLGPEQVRVFPGLSRFDYLARLCQGSLSIDSYPFGGFNTVIDALWCRKPMVVWQSDWAYGRFGAATLAIADLPELIARSKDEYVEKIVRCINDDEHRNRLVARVNAIDLKSAFARQENPAYFCRAIDYLIENHARLQAEKSREPILID